MKIKLSCGIASIAIVICEIILYFLLGKCMGCAIGDGHILLEKWGHRSKWINSLFSKSSVIFLLGY